jgi:hypothetical protein
MGVEKFKRPVLGTQGFAEVTEAVTLSTAVQTLANEGISFVTYASSGKASDALIPGPNRVGVRKIVVLDNQTTSLEANFNTASTGTVFWGTTANTITAASTVNNPISFELIGKSTSQWALVTLSSTVDWTLSASTGSTGQ